jgi:hypothetical protein
VARRRDHADRADYREREYEYEHGHTRARVHIGSSEILDVQPLGGGQ